MELMQKQCTTYILKIRLQCAEEPFLVFWYDILLTLCSIMQCLVIRRTSTYSLKKKRKMSKIKFSSWESWKSLRILTPFTQFENRCNVFMSTNYQNSETVKLVTRSCEVMFCWTPDSFIDSFSNTINQYCRNFNTEKVLENYSSKVHLMWRILEIPSVLE